MLMSILSLQVTVETNSSGPQPMQISFSAFCKLMISFSAQISPFGSSHAISRAIKSLVISNEERSSGSPIAVKKILKMLLSGIV